MKLKFLHLKLFKSWWLKHDYFESQAFACDTKQCIKTFLLCMMNYRW